jgi:antirestriction protein ArdC
LAVQRHERTTRGAFRFDSRFGFPEWYGHLNTHRLRRLLSWLSGGGDANPHVPALGYAPRHHLVMTLASSYGAAFLCAELGITVEPQSDHAQYLAHWLNVLKADKRMIFTATSKAAEAGTYLRRDL